jgi:tetrahydromethanopterin S-methyltransferase subunit B
MKVKVKLSSLLRQLSDLGDQPETLEVTASDHINPLECLQSLTDRFPSLRKWLYDEEGKLRSAIFVFVNGEKLLSDEMLKPLKDGEDILVVLAFAGG